MTLVDLSPGNSLFRFIRSIWTGTAPPTNDRALHRICNLMRKMGVCTAAVEDLSPEKSKRVAEDSEALERRLNSAVGVKAYRVTFFSCLVHSADQARAAIATDRVLASVDILNYTSAGLHRSYILDSVVAVPHTLSETGQRNFLLNNYVHMACRVQCEIQIDDEEVAYHITGTRFLQQNFFTYVCAHASLCMVLGNMGVPASPEAINRIIGVDHQSLMFNPEEPNRDKAAGIDKIKFELILNEYDLKTTSMDFIDYPNEDYVDFIYRYLESCCPTVLAFNTVPGVGHVVPVVGHTLNTDMWRPEAELPYGSNIDRLGYRGSSAWVDHLIIHDDNLGTYSCLPVDSLRRITLPRRDPVFRAAAAIAIIPPTVEASGSSVEIAALALTDRLIQRLADMGCDLTGWLGEFLRSRVPGSLSPVVARSFLANSREYLRNIEQEDSDGKAIISIVSDRIASILPDSFWLVECTVADLYTTNKAKIVDIICRGDSTIQPNAEFFEKTWIMVRLPGAVIIHTENGNFVSAASGSSGYVPLLRKEASFIPVEW